jgi:hypothetical protein
VRGGGKERADNEQSGGEGQLNGFHAVNKKNQGSGEKLNAKLRILWLCAIAGFSLGFGTGWHLGRPRIGFKL